MWCLESYSPVQPAKDVSRTNSRQIPDKFQTNSRVWKSLENSGKLGVWDFPDFSRLFQTLGFVWNVSGICLGCVWNVVGICRLEVVWDLSDISLESLILVPRGTPGIVRDSNDREVLTE